VPDYGADGTMHPDPLVHCPSCGADAIPLEASPGVNPSAGLACPSCGHIIVGN
jgi:ribosomal protein S27E